MKNSPDAPTVYFKLGGPCITFLFVTGMANLFENVFSGEHTDREYLTLLGTKLAVAFAIIAIFVADLIQTRRGRGSAALLITQSLLFVAAGILGFFLTSDAS